jgi:hypothetical protein
MTLMLDVWLCHLATTRVEDKVGSFSTKHLHWAKLIKEHVQQQENNEKDFKKIFNRIVSGCKETNPKFVTPGSFGHDFVCIPFHPSGHPQEREMEVLPSHAAYHF